MSALDSQPSNYNFLSSTGFTFFVKKLPTTNFFTESVNIPGRRITTTQQSTPFINISLNGNKMVYNDLTVTFIVDEDLENYLEISTWLDGLGGPESYQQRAELISKNWKGEGKESDCIINILTNTKNPNVRVTILDAFPTSLSDFILSSTQTSEEHVVATATFKYKNIKIERV